jgi:hypothetical protein
MRQPVTGTPPDFFGAPDWTVGAQNPVQDAFHASYGRSLGDSDETSAPSKALPDGSLSLREQRSYPSELNLLSELDDVVGNGIFDPANSQAQIHPDAGVFASHASRPGYLARERMFGPSEVLDVNTGKPTVYVPANGFYLDPRTKDVLRDRDLYEPGWPSTGGQTAPSASTWIPTDAAFGEVAAGQEKHGMKIMAAITCLGIGIFAGTVLMRKKKKPRSRR